MRGENTHGMGVVRKLSYLAQSVDPLIWFFIVGGIVFFGLVGVRSEDKAAIAMPRADVEAYVSDYRLRTGTEPQEADIHRFSRNWVKEEVLYREAKALNLMENDPVIRQRMIKKMQLVLAQDQQVLQPDERELRQYFREHIERYRAPETFSYQVVKIFAADVPAGITMSRYQELVQAALSQGADPTRLGLQGGQYRDHTEAAMAAVLDHDAAQAMQSAVPGQWQVMGSEQSAMLLQLLERREGGEPNLDDIRDRVVLDWKKARRVAAVEAQVEKLQSHYQIADPEQSL